MYGAIDLQEATAAVHFALDHGVTLVDTAEGYGPWRAEEVLGKALRARRKDVVLVTKVGLTWDSNGKMQGLDASRKQILSATEGCLTRLQTDWVDLLLMHWPDHQTPAEETIGALEELKRAGKIREYGVSNYSVDMMEQCEKYGHLATTQVGYHLFDRRVESRSSRTAPPTGSASWRTARWALGSSPGPSRRPRRSPRTTGARGGKPSGCRSWQANPSSAACASWID